MQGRKVWTLLHPMLPARLSEPWKSKQPWMHLPPLVTSIRTFSMVEDYTEFLESSQMVFVSIKWRISALNWSVGWIDRQIVLMIIYLCLFQTPQPLYKAIMAFSSQVHDSYYTNTVPSRLSLCRFFHMAIGVSQTWGFISESWHFVSERIYP